MVQLDFFFFFFPLAGAAGWMFNARFPCANLQMMLQLDNHQHLLYGRRKPSTAMQRAVLRPHGTMTAYNYITNALYQTNITVTGQPAPKSLLHCRRSVQCDGAKTELQR